MGTLKNALDLCFVFVPGPSLSKGKLNIVELLLHCLSIIRHSSGRSSVISLDQCLFLTIICSDVAVQTFITSLLILQRRANILTVDNKYLGLWEVKYDHLSDSFLGSHLVEARTATATGFRVYKWRHQSTPNQVHIK